MDRSQEELQFLGFIGIFKESSKIIIKNRNIFTKIALAFVMPLAFIYLGHLHISQYLIFALFDHEFLLIDTQTIDSPGYTKLHNVISKEWFYFWLSNVEYFTLLLILSLFSTSAIVYTIASIYSTSDNNTDTITFNKVVRVVPKVWKRLTLTFVCNFLVLFVYNFVSLVLFFICLIIIENDSIGIMVIVVSVILYTFCLAYITIFLSLATVVSVLEEDAKGIQALNRARMLVKGKLRVGFGIFFSITAFSVSIGTIYVLMVVSSWYQSGIRIGVAIGCYFLLFVVILVGLVVQTVVYFVCKSYHHEHVDKSSMADHLEAYGGDYVLLRPQDVQLQQFHV